MSIVWEQTFDNFGIKTVTRTDKTKKAYLPNAAQKAAIVAAGIRPSSTRRIDTFKIGVLNDSVQSISASYYLSERSPSASRIPEARMGRDFISRWINEGDRVLIGNVGPGLFAIKLAKVDPSSDTVNSQIANRADKETKKAILARANRATGRPSRQPVMREDFLRNRDVIQGVIIRSSGECEMPKCSSTLFVRDDGTPYLEVHHIRPLAEGGDDSMKNAVALCPKCHREVHFGKRRNALRGVLSKVVRP